MKSANRYKENTMKNINRYAAFSLRGVLATTIVMFGIIRSSCFLRPFQQRSAARKDSNDRHSPVMEREERLWH